MNSESLCAPGDQPEKEREREREKERMKLLFPEKEREREREKERMTRGDQARNFIFKRSFYTLSCT